MAKRPDKKPFVSKADRPEVKLKSDTPINSLTVRDLVTLLGRLGTGKDFWDGKDWQKDDFDGTNKDWKEDVKEQKDKEKEKDFKEGKEHKDKREIKEVKAEKIEIDGGGVFETAQDPRIERAIQALAGLSAKVDQLADQVAALKKGKG